MAVKTVWGRGPERPKGLVLTAMLRCRTGAEAVASWDSYPAARERAYRVGACKAKPTEKLAFDQASLALRAGGGAYPVQLGC